MIKRIVYWFRFIILYNNWLDLIKNRLLKINSREVVLRNGIKLTGQEYTPLTVVIDETFILDQYTPSFLKIDKSDIVVDIGAHVGDFSIFAILNGAKKVYAYEPDPSTFILLKQNILNNNIKNVNIIKKAVTNKKGLINFYKQFEDGGNSIYAQTNNSNLVKVESITLADIIKQNNLSKIDFLKIDIEGTEGLVFKSTKKEVWAKVGKISFEYHDNVSELKHNKIIKILQDNGFNTRCIPSGQTFGHIYAWR